MKYLDRWISNGILALQVFLLFLVVASNRIELPVFLMWSGKLHPLFLHLPIGFFLFSGILWMVRRYLPASGFTPIFGLSLGLTALVTPVTAIAGFFLSKEGGYAESLLQWHQWSGVVFSMLTWGLWAGFRLFSAKTGWWNGGLLLAGIGLLLTGHWGGQLTHGADFLAWPVQEEASQNIEAVEPSASSTFYAAYIQPVWQQKCVSCHRADKSKGGLVLEEAKQARTGGKSGVAWIPGDAAASLLVQRIRLPEAHKKHMPPRGKTQLTDAEIAAIESWIAAGADMQLTLAQVTENHPLRKFIQAVKQTDGAPAKTYAFQAASSATVEKLNDAFCVVKPVSTASPALQADFFIRKAFEIQRLDALQAVEEQLVRLNLSNMPIGDKDLDKLSGFIHLEKLLLNHTEVSDAGIPALKTLPALESLSLIGTRVSSKSGAVLATFPALKAVFLWNTQCTPEEVAQLQRKYPKIRWNHGFTPSPEDVLALSPPVFKEAKPVLSVGDSVYLKIGIPGAQIRYTLDGSVPDSLNGKVYEGPIPFKAITTVKARAFKGGWIGSEVAEMTFYKKGQAPEKIVLLTQPNAEYAPKPEVLSDMDLGQISLFRNGKWMGYKDRHMEALFYFNKQSPPTIRSVALSYGVSVGSYIVPPVDVEVWGGSSADKLALITRESVAGITMLDLADQESRGLVLPFKTAGKYPVYKLVVHNLPRLPDFHPGKGTPGWVFVDEVFFN